MRKDVDTGGYLDWKCKATNYIGHYDTPQSTSFLVTYPSHQVRRLQDCNSYNLELDTWPASSLTSFSTFCPSLKGSYILCRT